MPVDVSRALVTATSSSRFVVPNYWADPKSGIAYQVQVEIPRRVVRSPYEVEAIGSVEQLGKIPLKRTSEGQVLIRDVARPIPTVNTSSQSVSALCSLNFGLAGGSGRGYESLTPTESNGLVTSSTTHNLDVVEARTLIAVGLLSHRVAISFAKKARSV